MKIGEYLTDNGHITPEALNEALELQKHCKGKHVGDILVDMGVISKEDMSKYVSAYVSANIGDTAKWLKQKEVDSFFPKVKNPSDTN